MAGAASAPRIVLFHATHVAMAPVAEAMGRLWPEAEAVNLLDDGLTLDRAKEGAEISAGLVERFVDFGRYAVRIGADGVLVTCSAFGPAIDAMAAALPVPVVKPNEAMFRAALDRGSRIGMLATFGPSVPTMVEEFEQFRAEAGVAATLDTVVVADAIDLLRKGETESHNRLVAARAPEMAGCDAIMLAHFSTSRAAEAVRAVTDRPVLTAPDAAVARMKAMLS